jgi:hypothetical protein
MTGPRLCVVWCAFLGACNTGPTSSATGPAPTSSATSAPAASATTSTALPVSTMVARYHVAIVHAESSSPAASDLLPLVTLSTTDLLVGTESIAKVPSGPLGFEAALKRDGNRAALQVTPLDDTLGALRRTSPDTLRLLVDARAPYRTMLEVFFTATHAGFTSYEFVVAAAAGERALHITTPTRAQRKEARAGTAPPSMALVVLPEGFSLAVGEVVIGPGCTKGAIGNAVGRQGERADLDALARCASRVPSMAPEWGGVTTVQLSAAPEVTAEAVLSVVAVLLPTFPQVYFGLLR